MNPIKTKQQVKELINQALTVELNDIIVLYVEVLFTSDIAQRIAGIKLKVDFYDDGSEAEYYIKPTGCDYLAGFVVYPGV